MSSLGSASSKHRGRTCELCSVFIPNEASLQAHLKGQKHIKNLARQEEWKKKALSSVYVGGIKQLAAAELSLADYFSKFDNVKKITIDKTAKQYAIVELENPATVAKVLENKHHTIHGVQVVVKPREVRSLAEQTLARRLKQSEKEHVFTESLRSELADSATVDDQILLLRERLQLTEADGNLRELLCQLLESALQEILPDCEIQQFGSSANGFGVHGCDLDLHLKYRTVLPEVLREMYSHTDDSEASETETSNKSDHFKILTAVAEVIKQCVPDCHKVKTILSARLPVVRFYHKASNMRCDMSLCNDIAVRNTKYLRYCCSLYPPFQPLVYVIRSWMKYWELAGGLQTNGPRLNNYAVTLMVLFYLQERAFMPSLPQLRSAMLDAEPLIIGKWDCSFPEGRETLPSNCQNFTDAKLSTLLAGFFTFYAKVAFPTTIMDLSTATYTSAKACEALQTTAEPILNDTDSSANQSQFKISFLNIRDPFELNHNVAGNVNEKHLKIFTKQIRNTALACKMQRYLSKIKTKDWGILNLFVDHQNKEKNQEKDKDEVDFSLVISPSANWDAATAASLVLTVLREVFLISFTNDCSFTDSPNISVNQDGLTDLAKCESHSYCESTSEEPAFDVGSVGDASRKRKASSPDPCNYCKRAKLMLSSPTAERVSSLAAAASLSLPFSTKCSASHRLWEGRRKARRRLVQKGKSDLLELEKQVSKLLLSDRDSGKITIEGCTSFNESCSSADDSTLQTIFNFDVTFSETDTASLTISFQPESVSVDFKTFFHHLQVFLPSFIIKCMNH